MSSDLAIIIPAFKQTFLEKTLLSLTQQTNKNFTVYVGDDRSPYNLQTICNKFKGKLSIHYHRFENNMGAKHLVNQWKRCVELSKDEKWIWLFSDDDIADNNCVEVFYKTIEEDNGSFDIYRFNTRIINSNDTVIENTVESPSVESSFDMAMEILQFNRGNSIVDHIFSKWVYEKYNGFVYTDYAQAADWATSILFSSEKGIYTMQGAKVNWRLSGENLSVRAAYTNKMLLGHLQFCNWLKKHFAYLKGTAEKEYRALQKNIDYNLRYVIKSHYKGLYFFMYREVYDYYATNANTVKAFFSTVRLYSLVRLPKLFSIK